MTDDIGSLYAPELSPNGEWIIFTNHGNGLWLMRPDGKNPHALTDHDDIDPTWSPDGSMIAFASSRTGERQLFIMNADGSRMEQVIKAHKNSRVLIACVTRPLGQRIPHHLSTEDAGYLIEKIKPELAIITDFGMRVIQENPETQAKWIEERSGVKTIAARDFMTLELKKESIVAGDRIKLKTEK